jgi:alkylated DNA repair dioxygenase AlkB
MQKMGSGLVKPGFGFTIEELLQAKDKFEEIGAICEYIRLDYFLGDEYKNIEPAAVLFIRNGVEKITGFSPDKMFNEQNSFPWDKKYWDNRRGRVLNKRARHNVCFGNKSQEPDYEKKKGTIIPYDKVPITKLWRDKLEKYIGSKASNLEVEGNLYYDVKKCGIGYHGDGERRKVVAASLGASRPICWQWYHKFKKIGPRIDFQLNNGDMYIMSEKTTGNDWKKSSILTLRHAAGVKYIK